MQARILRWLFHTLTRLLSDCHVAGLENLPQRGSYIIAANHLSIADVAIIYAMIGNENLTGWAAEKWERHLVFGTLLRMGGGIFIRRGEVDRGALDKAVEWLRTGKAFGMAPEGTRSKTGGLQRGKAGIVYIAQQAEAPIVPCGLWGTERIWRTLLRLRRPRVEVHFGEPFRLAPLSTDERASQMRAQADEVMCRIAVLLPASYRGVYADHPRLKELLSAGDAPI
jgi:1-acyl-sn-glycerol-3-phosphate acyltransferase